MNMITDTSLMRMRELDSCISAWKTALKFGGSQDREFNEFCKNNISKLGKERVQVAESVTRATKGQIRTAPKVSLLKRLLGGTK